MEIFKSIIPIAVFIVINSALSVYLKKGFGKCLPFTLMSSVLLLYISQLIFKTFNIGLILLLLCFLISGFILYKHKDEKEYIFTNGFYYFLCICLIFIFINFGRHFFWDDELSHWGKMVKEMIRLDKFYFIDESTLRSHKDYPPFISVFELLWCKLSLGFDDANCTMALHVFEFGLFFAPIVEYIKTTDRKKIITLLFVALLSIGIIIYLDSENVFNAIYTDTVIAMEFAYSVYLVYSDEALDYFGLACFVLINIFMIMTKQVGIAFVMLSLFYYFLNNIKKLNNKLFLFGLLLAGVLPVVFYLNWNSMINDYDIVKQFDLSQISISGLKNILSGNSYQLETMKSYVNALFKKNIYNYPLPITFASSLLLELLLLFSIKFFTSKKNNYSYELTCIVGTLGYALMMFILYVFCYPEKEAVVLISYERYMSSMIGALLLGVLVIFVLNNNKALDLRKSLIITLLFMVLFNSNRLLNFAPQIVLGNRFSSYETIAEKLNNEVEPESRVFVLYDQNGYDNYAAFVAYYCDEIQINKINLDLNAMDLSISDNMNNAVKELKEYDYLYVVEASDSFNEYFAPMNNGNKYESNSLYIITEQNNNIIIEKAK